MKHIYSVCFSLRVCGILVSIFLQSCYTAPISHPSQSKSRQIVASQELGNPNKKYTKGLIDVEEAVKRKRKEEQPTSLAISTKSVLAQSTKASDKKVEADLHITSIERGVEKSCQKSQGVGSVKATQNVSSQRPVKSNLQARGKEKVSELDTKRDSVKKSQTEDSQSTLVGLELEEQVDIDVVDGISQSDIGVLPVELLEGIFSYITFEEMLPVREVNHFFHTLTTGYNRVGVVGIQNKPDSRKLVGNWYLESPVSFKWCKKFKKGIWNHETIPSFIFYQFMQTVTELPYVYWSCLPNTHVQRLVLDVGKITSGQAAALGEYLVGSKVQGIKLFRAQLGDIGVEAISRNIYKTDIEIINLHYNYIGSQGAEVLFENMQRSKVRKLDLSSNNIGSEGLKHISRYISNIPIESLSLISNKIEAETIKEFLKNLGKETSLKEIYLGGNKLTEEDSAFIRREYSHIKFC